MRLRSITARLTLLFAVASALVLLAFGHIVGTLVVTHFEMLDRDELDGKLQLVRHVIEKAPANGDLAPMRSELADALVGHRGLSVVVSAPGAPPLFDYGDAGVGAALIESAAADPPPATPVARTIERAGRVFRGIVAPADVRAQGQGRTFVGVALDVSHHRDFIAQFRIRLWLAIAAGVGLAALFGWFAARRGLEPLREMARVAKGVSATHLGNRLRAESFPDELVDLAAAFNDMLARLEDSFRRLSEFSSDLAHEFRTPISNLMTETQVALSRMRSADEYREVLYSNLEEHERLARTITDMLYLAHADHGLLVPEPGRIDLSLEVRELFAFYDALADERHVGLSLSGEGIVDGDRLMMRRALSNLLSNAIRHTPPGGDIQVSIDTGVDGSVRLRVANPGPTIAAEHLPRLFDRFYRVDASRVKEGDGSGLGLAITKTIVEAHRGKIGVSSADGRTCFEIVLPGPASIDRRVGAAFEATRTD